MYLNWHIKNPAFPIFGKDNLLCWYSWAAAKGLVGYTAEGKPSLVTRRVDVPNTESLNYEEAVAVARVRACHFVATEMNDPSQITDKKLNFASSLRFNKEWELPAEKDRHPKFNFFAAKLICEMDSNMSISLRGVGSMKMQSNTNNFVWDAADQNSCKFKLGSEFLRLKSPFLVLNFLLSIHRGKFPSYVKAVYQPEDWALGN